MRSWDWRWTRPPANQPAWGGGGRRKKGGKREELLLFFRIFMRNFQGTRNERGRVEEKNVETGRVSGLKIKERNKVPRRKKHQRCQGKMFSCVLERRRERSLSNVWKQNAYNTLKKLTTEVTFPERAYIEICHSGKKKSRRHSGFIFKPGEQAVVENHSVSFANSLLVAWFVWCLCMNQIPLSWFPPCWEQLNLMTWMPSINHH